MTKTINFLILCLSFLAFNVNANNNDSSDTQNIKVVLETMALEDSTPKTNIFFYLQEIKAYLSGATNFKMTDNNLEIIRAKVQKIKEQYELINEENNNSDNSLNNVSKSNDKYFDVKIQEAFNQIEFALKDNKSYRNTYKKLTYDDLVVERDLKLVNATLTKYECEYIKMEYGLENFREIFRQRFISVDSICVN